MDREERWKALAEADAAVEAAVAHRERKETRQARAAVKEAARVYTICLAHVIGLPAAQRYAISMQAYRDAIDRSASLNATMSMKPSKDAADVAALVDVAEEQIAAEAAFKRASTEVVTAVERAKARDNEPDEDEKGGA